MDTKKPHVKVNLIYFLATYTQQCQHNWKDLRRHRVKRNIHTLHLDLLHVLHSNSTSKWHLLTKGGGHPIQSKPFPTRSIRRSRSIVSWSTHKRATSHLISSCTSLQHNFSINARLRQFHGNFSKIAATQAFAPGVIPSFEAFTTMMIRFW